MSKGIGFSDYPTRFDHTKPVTWVKYGTDELQVTTHLSLYRAF